MCCVTKCLIMISFEKRNAASRGGVRTSAKTENNKDTGYEAVMLFCKLEENVVPLTNYYTTPCV